MKEHIPLVLSICKRMGVPSPIEDSEEFADGCMALVKYGPRWDVRRGKITTYLYPCIVGCIKRGRRARVRQMGLADSRTRLENYQTFAPLPSDIIYRDPEVAEIPQLKVLPDRSREIMEDIFIGKMTYRQVAAERKISHERVRQIVDASKARLRHHYGRAS